MRRRRSSPASLTESDDLLWEILLRLSPQPSSLPRASAVCKQWRRLATDPKFLRHFYAHHGKPPLLGVFEYGDKIIFRSILDSPDRIAPDRFDLGRCSVRHENDVLGCWHGRVLVLDHVLKELVVCTPLTGEQRRVAIPPELLSGFLSAAVLCAASDQGHVHGGCHSSPFFKVVLVSMLRKENQLLARVYSSETNAWGNLISTTTARQIFHAAGRATLVGKALYWLILPRTDDIIEFDLEKQGLAVIQGPPVVANFSYHKIIQAKDDAIGIALMSYPHFEMWQRNVNGHGVAMWVFWKTFELHNILGTPPQSERHIKCMDTILAYLEDINVIFLSAGGNVYMIELKSMESKRLHEPNFIFNYHPFASFYTPGATVASGCNGAKMLHNT